MRRVAIESVVYCSNQDPANPASNLLDTGMGNNKKWLCTSGETFCSVVLQLARTVKISAVYIGASQAALVEVLVGHSETPTIPCEMLLPTVEFVSYTAKNRMADGEQHASFSTCQLMHETRDKRWDRVRIVCSRPYDPLRKYGLSFIEIFEDVDENQPELAEALVPALPSRMMAVLEAESSSDDEVFNVYDKLARRQMRRPRDGAGRSNPGAQREQPAPQVVENIRSVKKVIKKRTKKTSRRRKQTKSSTKSNGQKKTPMHTDGDEQPNTKSHEDKQDQEQKKNEPPKDDKQEPSTSKSFGEFSDDKKEKTLNSSGGQNSSKDEKNENPKELNTSRGKKDSKDEKKSKDEETPPTQKKGDDRKQNKDQTAKSNGRKRPHTAEKGKAGVRASGRRPLGAVVFALSGFSAARRARLRAAAEALGARFLPAWSPRCTHLICASSNTAELRLARASRGACVAVHGAWLERCGARRRRLPWQWFAAERAHRLRPPRDHDSEERPDAEASQMDSDSLVSYVLITASKKPPSGQLVTPQHYYWDKELYNNEVYLFM